MISDAELPDAGALWRPPTMHASFSLGVGPGHRTADGFEQYYGSATVSLYSGDFRDRRAREVVSAGLTWGGPVRADEPLHEAFADLKPDGSEWVLEIDRPKIARDFRGDDFELRLVCAVLRQFSINRACIAVMCVEPLNWQSLKVDDRARQRDVLRAYWVRHGFDTVMSEGYVARRVRDFQPPAPFDSWGPYTDGPMEWQAQS